MQNFSSADYLPQVLEKPAPDFDLTTLHGERLRSSQLRGKKVVLDFWSVWCGWCLPELKPLQDFQEKHPELVVATVVDASTDVKKIEAVRRTRKLTSLRISRTSSDLPEKFNAVGVPNTLIIDEDGYVRIWHSGSIPDVSRYLEADSEGNCRGWTRHKSDSRRRKISSRTLRGRGTCYRPYSQ